MNKKNPARSGPLADLTIGEKLHLSIDNDDTTFPVLLEDISSDERLLISMPMQGGVAFSVPKGDKVRLFYFRQNGRFTLYTVVEDITNDDQVRLIKLKVEAPPDKEQRRNSFRLDTNMDASLRLFGDGSFPPSPIYREEDMPPWEKVLTNNLSETGVSLNSGYTYNTGDCVQLLLILDVGGGVTERVELLGLVRQAQPIDILGKPYCRMGIEFLPYTEPLRRKIAKFLLYKQQLLLKMRWDR